MLLRIHAPDLALVNDTSSYFRKMLQLSPAAPITPAIDPAARKAESAFHRELLPGRDVATPVLDAIFKRYKEYDSQYFFAPYAAIVGPSGIGKSFTIQQIARSGTYVVYTCLAKDRSHSYPRRSVVADEVDEFTERGETTIFFESFLAASLCNVQLCRDLGISPLGLFDILVKKRFERFQEKICDVVHFLYERAKAFYIGMHGHPRVRSEENIDYGDDGFYQEHVNHYLPDYRREARKIFEEIYHDFANDPIKLQLYLTDKNSLARKSDKPDTLMCFDEARGLFSTDGKLSQEAREMKFLALRRAMRHMTKISKHEDRKQFFGLFLDTTARMADFTPPHGYDASLKWNPPGKLKLLKSIFELDSFDVFGISEEEGWSQLRAAAMTPESAELPGDLVYLLSLGRPLWGALLQQPGGGAASVLGVADTKMFGGRMRTPGGAISTVEALALLSYRVNFYVGMPALADTLTTHYLRYIVGVDEDRTFMQTAQPTEPILAHSSANVMRREPAIRLEVLRALYDSVVKGTIHLGDLGEIAATLLLLFSFDKLFGQQYARPRPMKLARLVESLFGSDSTVLAEVVDRMNDNDNLQILWGDGCVFFTHFVRLSDPPTHTSLRRAFYHGAALFPPPGFKGCDIIVPVYLPASDTMSYFLLQVKNRKNDVMTPAIKTEARDSLRAAAKLMPQIAMGHLAMMMSLRSLHNHESAATVYPGENNKYSQMLRSATKDKGKGQGKANGNGNGNGKSQRKSKGEVYNFNDMHRVVVLAVGMSLDLYSGLVHPAEEDDDDQQTSAASLKTLKKLLACTSDVNLNETSSYHRHLGPIG